MQKPSVRTWKERMIFTVGIKPRFHEMFMWFEWEGSSFQTTHHKASSENLLDQGEEYTQWFENVQSSSVQWEWDMC